MKNKIKSVDLNTPIDPKEYKEYLQRKADRIRSEGLNYTAEFLTPEGELIVYTKKEIEDLHKLKNKEKE